MILKIIVSFISLLAGLAGFFTFLVMKNYQASCWAFLTGLAGGLTLTLHYLRYKNHIADYYSAYSLWSLAWIGFSVFALAVSGLLYNLITYCVLRPPLLPVENSSIISAIWCVLTIKTGGLLFWYGRKYAHYVQIDRTRLIPTETEPETAESP